MVNGKNNQNIKSQHLIFSVHADQWNFREDDDNYFEQPGKLFNLMSKEQQQVLFENTGRNMNGVDKHIQLRHIVHCYKADPAYGQGVAERTWCFLERSGSSSRL